MTDICNKYDFKFAVYKILNKFFEVLLTKKKTRIQSTCKLHSKAFNWVQYNYITWSWMHFLYYVTYFCKNYKAPINLIKKRIAISFQYQNTTIFWNWFLFQTIFVVENFFSIHFGKYTVAVISLQVNIILFNEFLSTYHLATSKF